MAERSPSDVLRNELVSSQSFILLDGNDALLTTMTIVFLRELEYYQGIIFLTTNLLATVDNAFRSRVSIHLLFSPLSVPSRMTLWRKMLERLPPVASASDSGNATLSIQDVGRLAQWELNGREIKNTIKTVRTWCLCKGFPLTLSRLENAIAVTAPQARKIGVEA